MQMVFVTVEDVFSDEEFNSRGPITAFDVQDLIEDIPKHGLLQPIVIQKYEQGGYKYKIVAGHRRHKAWSIVSDEPIPAILVDEGEEITEEKARILNMVENMKRKDINILQEAKAIEPLVKAGKTLREIGKELGVSSGWVQTRHNVLSLPPDVQQEVALGILTTAQINQLYSVRAYPDTMRDLLKAMKSGRRKGKTVKIQRQKSLDSRVKRNSNDIINMIEFLGQVEFGFHTRCLAWAAGTISTTELFGDFHEYCEDNCLTFPVVPDRF